VIALQETVLTEEVDQAAEMLGVATPLDLPRG
jgi:hypothetical protein